MSEQPKIIKYQLKQWPAFVRASKKIRRVDTVLDVGAGIRPQQFIQCKRHVCVEPHGEYCEILRDEFEVIQGRAPDVFDEIDFPVDTVFMLDCIEHMTKEDGAESLRRACAIARHQVVVFTPLGFMPQETAEIDAWGLRGGEWQAHKSGWNPEDFPGLDCLIEKEFAFRHDAFFAIWTRK